MLQPGPDKVGVPVAPVEKVVSKGSEFAIVKGYPSVMVVFDVRGLPSEFMDGISHIICIRFCGVDGSFPDHFFDTPWTTPCVLANQKRQNRTVDFVRGHSMVGLFPFTAVKIGW